MHFCAEDGRYYFTARLPFVAWGFLRATCGSDELVEIRKRKQNLVIDHTQASLREYKLDVIAMTLFIVSHGGDDLVLVQPFGQLVRQSRPEEQIFDALAGGLIDPFLLYAQLGCLSDSDTYSLSMAEFEITDLLQGMTEGVPEIQYPS